MRNPLASCTRQSCSGWGCQRRRYSELRSNQGGCNRPACAPNKRHHQRQRTASSQRDLLDVLGFLFGDITADLNRTRVCFVGELGVLFVGLLQVFRRRCRHGPILGRECGRGKWRSGCRSNFEDNLAPESTLPAELRGAPSRSGREE